jgi:diguanylate cyclase (GGDEF)-like protein/PAS domain S-box-containing protein
MAKHFFSVAQTEVGGGNDTGVGPPQSTSVIGHLAAADESRSRPITLPIVCAVALIMAIAAGTSILLFHFRDRALADGERELTNTALILAEQSDQAFQAVDVVEKSLIEQIQSRGILSSEDFERQMSGQDMHLILKDKIIGLPYAASVSLFNSEGKLINFSRFWPIPALNVADQDHFKALKFDAHLTSVVSGPVLNQTTRTWNVYLARKITGPNGEFLGAVSGGLELQHFENFFGKIALGADSAIALFRGDGVLLVRHPRRESPGTSFAQGELFKNVLSHVDHGVVRLTSPIDGEERLIAGHALAHYPVVVAVGKTVTATLADWQHEAKLLIGAGTLAALVILVFSFLIARRILQRDKQIKQWLGQQKFIRDMAINNMSQGLLMFDTAARLVLCNQRYIEIYGLSPEVVKPGCALIDIVNHRKATGSFAGDPQQYCSEILAEMEQGTRKVKSIETTDGRTIHVVNEPMTNGWWTSAHEDVTERRRVEVERDRIQKFLNTILDNVPAPIFVKEASEQRYVLVNRAGEKFWGVSRAEMIGKTSHEVFPKKEADLIAARDEQLLRSDQPLFDERQIITPCNGIRSIVSKRLVVRDDDGASRYVVGVIEDVTERKRAEQELDETKRFLDSIIENIPIAVVVKDAMTRQYVLVNRAFETMLDLPRSDLLGKTVFDIHRTKDAELIDRADSESLQDSVGVNYKEFEVETPMRGSRVQATSRLVIRDSHGDAKYLVAVIEDVTERKKSEQRIAFMAHHDALTGLANRVAVAEKIEEAAARQRRWGEQFAVLLLDLDHFKDVNDTLGHSAGDELLREVAARLKASLRETDVLARLGGDEFAIIQAGETDQRQATSTLADRLIDIIAKPFNIDGTEVHIAVSIGIALAPDHATGTDNLLKMADMALYSAKSAGRNGYRFFGPEMSAAVSERQGLESDLRRAIAQDELELHYQPIIDTMTRKICGAEALIRWRHPTKGMIPPDQFIPLAEETGLITEIGEWVLHTACIEAATWPAGVKVAVNLSPVQFRKRNLPDVVMYALAQSGLPPERLELEITETALMESAANCLPALRQFKNLGIAIALDDFGTGYSSLSQLTMFPFDKIKIDKSFTQNLTNRAECAAIISATLTLAQSLDIATTAEGVETLQQYQLLRLAGVTSLQGFLFKCPGLATDIDFDGVYSVPGLEDAA